MQAHSTALAADCYLLQIQQYNVSSPSGAKPRTEGAAIKAEAEQADPGSSAITPATGQKETPPIWYDVDIVKGTQYTVSGYQVPSEGGRNGVVSEFVSSIW